MTNHKLTGNQIQCIFILFWMGSVVLSGGSREAKQDYWASVLIAALLYSPVLAVYVRISSLYPGLNLFEIIFKIFGKFMGRVITLFFLFLRHLSGSYVNPYDRGICSARKPAGDPDHRHSRGDYPGLLPVRYKRPGGYGKNRKVPCLYFRNLFLFYNRHRIKGYEIFKFAAGSDDRD